MKLILATLACLVLFVQGTTVDVKEAKMDQKVIQQMLTPLLTKYSIHGPLRTSFLYSNQEILSQRILINLIE